MNKVAACSLLLINFINGMDSDPADIIKFKLANPTEAINQLKNFSSEHLSDYRDLDGNNLLHITVTILISRKDESNYDQLQREAEDLIFYLTNQKKVKLNGRNNYKETPLLVLYKDNDPKKHTTLEQILKGRGAKLPLPSPAHEAKECLELSVWCCCTCLNFLGKLCCCRSKQD